MLRFDATDHPFDPLLNRLSLSHPWVWGVSVRMAGTFVEGRDYEADLGTGTITRLEGEATGRIEIADTVLVSYSHAGGSISQQAQTFSDGVVQLEHGSVSDLVIEPVESVIYQRDRDYELDSKLGIVSRIEDGAIEPGETVSISFSAFGVYDSSDLPTYQGLYCNPDELEAAIGTEELISLSNTGNSGKAEEPDYAKISITIENMSGTINAHVDARYQIPLASTPDFIRSICIELVRYQLDPSQGEEFGKLYEAALKRLERITKQQVSLGQTDTATASEMDAAIASSETFNPFTSTSLGGWN